MIIIVSDVVADAKDELAQDYFKDYRFDSIAIWSYNDEAASTKLTLRIVAGVLTLGITEGIIAGVPTKPLGKRTHNWAFVAWDSTRPNSKVVRLYNFRNSIMMIDIFNIPYIFPNLGCLLCCIY